MNHSKNLFSNSKLFIDPFWNEDRVYSRFEAWIDLLQNANEEDTKQLTGNRLLEIRRGQLAVSLRQLAKRWKWSKHKVDDFFDLLIAANRIIKGTAEKTGKTVLMICDYEAYNPQRASAELSKGQDGDTSGTDGGQGEGTRKEGDNEVALEKAKAEFEKFRKLYPGTKMGLATEFENFKKKNPNYQALVFALYPALESLLEWRKQRKSSGRFVPEMANLQTWINQRRWEVELENTEETNGNEKEQKPVEYYTFD